jgi:ABC-type lipoprotein release transport system permease subunit
VSVFFIAVAGVACIGPSLRAATVDPTAALREE